MRDVNPKLFWVQQKFVVLLSSVILDISSLNPQGTRFTQSCGVILCIYPFILISPEIFVPFQVGLKGS